MGIYDCGNNVLPNIKFRLLKNMGGNNDKVTKVLPLIKEVNGYTIV